MTKACESAVAAQISSTSPDATPDVPPAECGVSASRLVSSIVAVGHGALWAVMLGVPAFLYGLYYIATGETTGVLIPLTILVAISIFLIHACWHYRRLAALVRYELGVSALWIGFFNGSICLTNFVNIAWFCMFAWPWLIFALVGGLMLASPHERRTDSRIPRTVRACALVMLVAASGLLAYGFVPLLLFENRPITAFVVVKAFGLRDVAFSADGNTLATIGGCSGEGRIARLWNARIGMAKGGFTEAPDKDNESNEKKCVAVQFMRDSPALAIASYSHGSWSDNRPPYDKLVIRVWDIASGQAKRSFEWDDYCLGRPLFSDDGALLAYCGREGHIRVFETANGTTCSRSSPHHRAHALPCGNAKV